MVLVGTEVNDESQCVDSFHLGHGRLGRQGVLDDRMLVELVVTGGRDSKQIIKILKYFLFAKTQHNKKYATMKVARK